MPRDIAAELTNALATLRELVDPLAFDFKAQALGLIERTTETVTKTPGKLSSLNHQICTQLPEWLPTEQDVVSNAYLTVFTLYCRACKHL